MEQCCGTCKWWRKYPSKVQKQCELPHPIGMCKDVINRVPSCISDWQEDDMYDIDGKECKCYEQKK